MNVLKMKNKFKRGFAARAVLARLKNEWGTIFVKARRVGMSDWNSLYTMRRAARIMSLSRISTKASRKFARRYVTKNRFS